MCSRYTLICDDGFSLRFGLAGRSADCRSSYNVAPGRTMPVIIVKDGGIAAVPMRWGLVPHVAKDGRATEHVINARSETLPDKPMFKRLLKTNRCLVPASGFYEWIREGTRRVPYYIRPRGEQYFSFAGLYDVWRDPQGAGHPMFTIITTRSNDLVAPVHDRMPAILQEEAERTWLSDASLAATVLDAALAPYPAGRMEAYPVGSRVNNPSVDEETLVRPLATLV